jgi:thymidylate synthase (FAD)
MEQDYTNVHNKVNVLDHGYVILHEVLGTDLTVVNSARVSYDKRTEELRDSDKKLINFLLEHGHMSPFRHAMLQFEFNAPMMVCRQHWRYIVGSDHTMDSYNESSRRYVTDEPTFYIPQLNEWRSAPDNKKQGSGDPVSYDIGGHYTQALINLVEQGLKLYEAAMSDGIAAEQARLFLPSNGMYVRYYWTASLQSVIHFLQQRLEHDAQKEIQVYAQAVRELARERFPYSIGALINE